MKKTTLSFLVSAALITAGNAATITWSGTDYENAPNPLKNNMGVDQFDESGTLEFAVNLGGLGAQNLDQTNDISFAASDASLNSSALDNNSSGFHANTGGNNNISRSAAYSNSGAATISLSNLISGNQYRIQVLLFDGRSEFNGRTAEFDGNDLGIYAYGVNGLTWGNGLLATGIFTADATSQTFTQENFETASSIGGQINAILLHDLGVPIPEPSSAALLGLGSLALILRRRK